VGVCGRQKLGSRVRVKDVTIEDWTTDENGSGAGGDGAGR